MTPEQQLQQLLTEAQELTSKMREALAKMESTSPSPSPATSQWTPKKGDWAEVTFVYPSDVAKGLKIGDVVKVDEDNSSTPHCILPNGERYQFFPMTLRHLPDYQPQPKLATTYDEVVEEVKPLWVCDVFGDIEETYYDPYQLPTKSAARQDAAFIKIKNLEAYCADRFEGEMHCSIIVLKGNLCKDYRKHAPFHFSKEAGEWLIENHPEPFLVFYGVK